jgi:hypothetical protein
MAPLSARRCGAPAGRPADEAIVIGATNGADGLVARGRVGGLDRRRGG